MKRFFSVLLASLMIVTLCSALLTANAAGEKTIITHTNPVITANVGDTVDFSNYLVRFSTQGAAVEVEWYKDGVKCTSAKPTEKGVTAYSVKKGSDTLNVYVVAKEKSETEYVLFEADFSKYDNIKQLKDDGFVTSVEDSYYSFADGCLVMGTTAHDYVRLMLPAWLGDFGDYSISADIKMLETTNNSRWFGLVYRIQNENKSYYPYYHMCVRENTTSANGIEFAERTSANNWNVASTASGDIASLKTQFNTLNIKAFEKNIQYNINGNEEMHISNAVLGIKAPLYEKGQIGITMNYGKVAVKSIKVAVQSAAPERPKRFLNLINNAHQENNLINPIANVEALDSATALENISATGAGNVLIKVSDFEDLKPVTEKCIENQVLPTFLLETQDDVKKLNSAMNASQMKDANAISRDAKLLNTIRSNKSLVRTGLIIDIPEGEFNSDVADVLRRDIRKAPATFCVISSKDASYAVVDELQELAVAVWVTVDADPTSEEYTAEALRAVTSGANGIITKKADKLTEVINGYLEKNTMTRTPVMIGHRGNPGQAPENTLSGFIKAYENGADVFEVDVEITKDGEIVIMHDNTINRTTNYTGNLTVSQMTLAEIKQYNIKAKNGSVTDEKVPTLKEVFEEFKDKDCKIFVEFKGGNALNIKTTCDLIKEYGMEDKVDVISFNTGFLTQTQAQIPGMSTGYLHGPSGNSSTPEDALEALYPSLSAAQNFKSTINASQGVVSIYYTQAATDRGMTVWPWTYVASSNNGAFLSGCDGVTTDDMQWVTKMAKYLKAETNSVILGDNASAGVKYVTYGNKEVEVKGDELIVKVISGGDCISIENGTIKGLKEGNATVIYGYKAKTTANSEYVIYTQPMTITVGNAVDETPSEADNGEGGLGKGDILVIVISAVVALLAVGAAVFFTRKKK